MTPACPVTGHISVGWDVDANLILVHIVATLYCDKHVGTQHSGCVPHSQALRCRQKKPGTLTTISLTIFSHSLVPRPLPDFISQPWRKIGRRPGTITTSRTGNGGLDSYVMWTRFHNDGNVPTQYAASTPSDLTVKFV